MTATLTRPKRRFVELARTKGRVDATAGIIYGVKLLGRNSRNGREYSENAMRDAVPMYEGKKVYVDHPTRETMQDDRKFGDWAGVIRNPRYESGAVYGDIHLRQKSRHYDELIEAAERFNSAFGLSHVADGESRMRGGIEVIESITDVFSVDIVTDPATTAGLFESATTLPDSAAEQFASAVDELRALGCPDDTIGKLTELGETLFTMVKSFEVNGPVQESYHRPSAEPYEFQCSWMRPKPTDVRRFANGLRSTTDVDFSEPGSFARRYR